MTTLIPFQIEAQRVIQLLAKQIYQSPLALLRENTQNAFDAVRQRLYRDPNFTPRIEITLAPDRVTISDNGIGMTSEDLREHYWKAGSSSKNNADARAAGVVGTFGIGAMANFGIADSITVETESIANGERSFSRAVREKLSLKEDCIELQGLTTQSKPGTTITADISAEARLDVAKATSYIREFISYVEIPVFVNGELVSQKNPEMAVPPVPESVRLSLGNERIGDRLRASGELVMSNNADIWLHLMDLSWEGKPLPGRLILRSGHPNLQTYRSGFGLATASVNSAYQFGGLADLLTLEPTAGREAITVDGVQLLQSLVNEIDTYVSLMLAGRDECDVSTPFMNWVIAHGRYDLCDRLRMTISPGDRLALAEIAARTHAKPMMLYDGADQAIIKLHASEESPVLILARNNPRRRCEQNYLQKHAKTEQVSNDPVVSNVRSGTALKPTEQALAYRIESILDTDYFLKARVSFGSISHNLPVLARKGQEGVEVVLNPEGTTVQLLIELYQTEYSSFSGMAKDFARNVIFPRVADFVPSSTRQGAEAFLKAIRRPREVFELADDDLGSLPQIWEDYNEGRISMEMAVQRSQSAVRSSVQFVDVSTARRVEEVVPDLIQNERVLEDTSSHPDNVAGGAVPALTRLEASTAAKLLIIDDSEPALRGYRAFLAITDKAREEMGDFFLQPHKTSVVWGGQKTLFIFQHHSGEFGVYYDLQTRELVDAPTGGGAYPTATIVLKNRIFIPVPDPIRATFVPASGERKRFEVRADILRTGLD